MEKVDRMLFSEILFKRMNSARAATSPVQHKAVGRVFEALNGAKIAYALLRLPAPDPESHVVETDILIHPQELDRAKALFLRLQFVALSSWGFAPHHFFQQYDALNSKWIMLDVVTELRYGAPFRWLRLNLRNLWKRTSWRMGVCTLSAEDEFVSLLLHCWLDKRRFDARHQVRLLELCSEMNRNSGAEMFERQHQLNLGVGLQWLCNQITAGNWDALLRKRSVVARHLYRRQPIANLVHLAWGVFARATRPVLAIRRRGLWTAIIGPDGAGKTTCAAELVSDPVLHARMIYAGENEECINVRMPWSKSLERWVERAESTHSPLYRVLRRLRSLNRAVEAWWRITLALAHRARGRMVVFDRYNFAALDVPQGRLKRLLRLLRHGYWPAPDLLIVLDAPGEVLYARKHEHSIERLEQDRWQYRRLAESLPEIAHVVDATNDQRYVVGSVISLSWQRYARLVQQASSAGA